MNYGKQLSQLEITQQFYAGMTQATLDARTTILPQILHQFDKRGMRDVAEREFSKTLYFRKRLHQTLHGLPTAPIQHGVSRFALEFFCCISALNLYRLTQYAEQFMAELQGENFFACCSKEELEWLGVYNADLPYFRQDTGHMASQWRVAVIKSYLMELNAKSSRDADTLVALRRFFHRQQLSKGAGVEVTPAMHEACAQMLENSAGWLEHYLKFHS